MIIFSFELLESHPRNFISKKDKSVYVAQVKHNLNFPYDSGKLYLMDSRSICLA